MTPKNPKIGFRANNMDELKRFAEMPEVNLVELKPQFFGIKQTPIYTLENGVYRLNPEICSQIKDIAGDMQVQIHIPYERENNPSDDAGLVQALEENHDSIMSRFKMFAQMAAQYGFPKVVTMHPPATRLRAQDIATEKEAIESGNKLYKRLDQYLRQEQPGYRVGIENVCNPKLDDTNLGYKISHLAQLLQATNELGLTLDSGHILLSDVEEQDMHKLAQIVNNHFHTNPGVFDPDSYNDDKHEFATRDNHPGYDDHIKLVRQQGIPVILEVNGVGKMPDEDLIRYVKNLRKELS